VLARVDRIQIAAPERRDVVAAFAGVFGAEVVREDRVACLAAARSVLRLGTSEVEVLEPDGVGRIADWLGRSGTGLFGAGFAAPDPHALAAHWRALGRAFAEEREQLFLSAESSDLPGLHAVVSRLEEREPIGLVRALYEVTLLAADHAEIARRVAGVFGLDAGRFHAIRSEPYGYAGTLTLFRGDALDRIEVVTPFDDTKTMGRFFRRHGPRLYMAYAESDDPAAIRTRLLEHAPRHWTGPRDAKQPDNLYVHPKALGGVLLGVSRTSFGWTWSGHPERVVPA
jgi:hypothetical protein